MTTITHHHGNRHEDEMPHFFRSMTIVAFIWFGASLTVMFAAADAPTVTALSWSRMPLVGAMIASGMAFALNRTSEKPKNVIGRAMGALMIGVGIPRLLTYVHPWLKEMFLDDVLLILGGFVCGLVGYAIAAPLVDKLFKVSPDAADRFVGSQMDKYLPPKDK